MNFFKRFFLFLLFSCAALPFLAAQTGEGRGEDLTIKIAVMGAGDELYFWWGHVALVIDDARTGSSRFYDYGLFSFENEHFFTNFALGRLLYSCGVSPAADNIAIYVNTNRDVAIYTLDLPSAKRAEIRDFAENNVRPENKNYFYHHFKDNCSTRIRDIIDLATDGRFKERYGNAPGRFTLRQHVRRHTWFSPAADWFLNFLMGQDIDLPITVWEEMFLPAEVGKRINEFSWTGQDGVTRQLVSGSEIIFKAEGRPPVLDVPRKQWPRELFLSIILSLIVCVCYFMQSKYRAGQVLLGICHSVFGLFFGISGTLLYFMSFFTDHDYCWHNANVLYATPLLLAAIPFGIRYAKSRNAGERLIPETALRLLWLLVALGIFVSMLIKLSSRFWQQNLVDQMLMLPLALVLSLEPFGLKRILLQIFKRRQ